MLPPVKLRLPGLRISRAFFGKVPVIWPRIRFREMTRAAPLNPVILEISG